MSLNCMLLGHDFDVIDIHYSDEYTVCVLNDISAYLGGHFESRKDIAITKTCRKCGCTSRDVSYVTLEY